MKKFFYRVNKGDNLFSVCRKFNLSPLKVIYDNNLVEDILDSGNTLKKLSDLFLNSGANSVRICTMLDKPARRVADIKTDFRGFIIEDQFIVGYGLDYNELYRNLPYVAILKPEAYM